MLTGWSAIIRYRGKTDAQIARAAGSKLKNWWLTDIEKVLVEGERLNPATKNMLPFEAFHEVTYTAQSAVTSMQEVSMDVCVDSLLCV